MATLFGSGTVAGSSSVTGSAALAQISSGTSTGSGSLGIPPVEGSGTVFGFCVVTGDGVLLFSGSGTSFGAGILSSVGVPNPIFGTSVMTGEPVTEVMPPPYCGCSVPTPVTPTTCSCGGVILVASTASTPCSCSGSGQFRWGEFFKKGDLSLFLRDSNAGVMPNAVSYTLYWLRNGHPFQAGPAHRTPARGGTLGEFYVTGKVGEFGQPGDWMVRWYIQRNFFSPLVQEEFRFTVLDAVAVADPRDITQRYLKYGWD